MIFTSTKRKDLKDGGFLFGLVAAVSIVMGFVSHYLLVALSLVSSFRTSHNEILLFLPFVGTLTAYIYGNFGKGSQKGNNLIIESTQSEITVPLRMGFFTFIFTILTHLFGGSAGREGSAVQIGGVLSNKAAKFFGLKHSSKKQLIHAGISAGFASIFGTPLAGAFFGMEMVYIGKMERKSLISCFLAAYLADYTAKSLGTIHEVHRIVNLPEVSLKVVIIVGLSAISFGIFGHVFAWWIHTLKKIYNAKIKNYLLRALVAALIFVASVFILNGQKYEGLSLNLIDSAFAGTATFFDSVLKLFFTGLTLGAGFQGGEVTPLFDIGSTLGSSIGSLTGISPSFLAALGLISVFGCAANAPITTIMLGIDLFGVNALPYYVLASFISYSVSGHQGIYTSQIISLAKLPHLKYQEGYRLSELKEGKNKP